MVVVAVSQPTGTSVIHPFVLSWHLVRRAGLAAYLSASGAAVSQGSFWAIIAVVISALGLGAVLAGMHRAQRDRAIDKAESERLHDEEAARQYAADLRREFDRGWRMRGEAIGQGNAADD